MYECEINQLTWDDVDSESRCITLYIRKKKDGNLTPRIVPMTQKLYEVMSGRFMRRVERSVPWVFFYRYWDDRAKQFVVAPFKDRKRIMRTLCKKAGVPYFRFHALRY